jgi:hypothetical protein
MDSACTGHPSAAAPLPIDELSARIQQQLVSMRGEQVQNVLQLRARLQSLVFDWDGALLAQALEALHSAARAMYFQPLRQGWFARLLGCQRTARTQFIEACERAVACASQAKDQLAELAVGRGEPVAQARRVLAELDFEGQALNAGIDRGVTGLQEMCTQLAHARMRDDDDEHLAALAGMAQLYTQEFKLLQSIGSQAHEIGVRGNSVLARRVALLEQARNHMDAFDQAWLSGVRGIVAELGAGRQALRGLPKAIEVHEQLLKRLSASADACTALQHEEHLLAHQLGMLERDIER